MGRSQPLPVRIGRYDIQGELGRGMMGIVYKAIDPRLDRPVALKVIDLSFPVSDAERALFERRFLTEGQIVSRLSHAGIVEVYEVGRDEPTGAPYLALEFLVGQTLEERLQAGEALDWREGLRIVARVATALHYAHGQAVVHRDIKPANIMVQSTGEPKIMDFGLARLEVGVGLTTTGQLVGTPLYMSPEQTFGGEVDGRSDLFSLGSLTYALITGRPAFEADAVPLILNRIAYAEPEPPSALVRDLPAALDYVLARVLAKHPDDRYPDGETLAEDIEDVLKQRRPRHQDGWRPQARTGSGTLVSPQAIPGPARGESAPPATRRASGRRRWGLLAASLCGLAAALLASDFWRPRLLALADPNQRAAAAAELRGILAATAEQASARLARAVEEARGGFEPASFPAPASTPAGKAGGATPAGDEAELVSEESVAWARHVGQSQAGRLSVSLERPLEGSTVAMWMDDILAFRARVRAGEEKRQLIFKTVERGYLGVLPVPPGERQIRIEIGVAGNTHTASVAERFDPGQSRHLVVGTLLDGELSLVTGLPRFTRASPEGTDGK